MSSSKYVTLYKAIYRTNDGPAMERRGIQPSDDSTGAGYSPNGAFFFVERSDRAIAEYGVHGPYSNGVLAFTLLRSELEHMRDTGVAEPDPLLQDSVVIYPRGFPTLNAQSQRRYYLSGSVLNGGRVP